MPFEEINERSRTDSARRRNPHVNRSYIIPVLRKALLVIEVMKSSERPLNVDQLAKITGIAKSTVYRILRTLSAYGYLPDGADGIYSFRHVPYPPNLSAGTGAHSHIGDLNSGIIQATDRFTPKGKSGMKADDRRASRPSRSTRSPSMSLTRGE